VTHLQNSRQTDLTDQVLPCSQLPGTSPDISSGFFECDAMEGFFWAMMATPQPALDHRVVGFCELSH
jgi:hypothetical protein